MTKIVYTRSRKLLAATVTTMLVLSLLSLTTIFTFQWADAAVECFANYGSHCYGTSVHTLNTDQFGGRMRMKYVAPTSITSPAEIVANPFWAIMPTGQFVEVAWIDKYPVGSPYCTWTIDGSMQATWGTPPTTLTWYYLHDDNQDKKWTIIGCGSTYTSNTLTSSKVKKLEGGYETSYTDDVNTNEIRDVQYLSSSFVWTYIDHLTTGNSSKHLNPGVGYLWVHYCDTASTEERSDYMYGDGTEGNPC